MNKEYNLEKQHIKGKLHAIERIKMLLDENSFCEIGSGITNYGSHTGKDEKKLPYDGVITGYGTILGRTVFVYAQDFSVNGGTLGLRHGKKIAHIIELAIKKRCPVIGINDSGGARIQEGVNALAGYGDVFYYNTLASGYIPQISIIAGPCAGGAVYSPGITDFIFVIENISKMFVTGPEVVKHIMGQSCTAEELGGARVHAEKSGVAHFYHKTEKSCFEDVRRLIKYLPNYEEQEKAKEGILSKKVSLNNIDSIIPKESKKAYDVRKIITELVDDDSFFEIEESHARNLITGFAKLNNITVGIVASQPAFLGGALDCDSSDKGARFVRFCDAYDIPLITLVDVPGFLPGLVQENAGIIRHGAKLLYAYAEATTIKLTVILRKAYGGAYIAMCSKHLRADMVYCWPEAEIAVMGAEGAVPIIYGNQLKGMMEEEKKVFLEEQLMNYKKQYINATTALEEGFVDELLLPEETRERLYKDLVALEGKKDLIQIHKKHGNIPL